MSENVLPSKLNKSPSPKRLAYLAGYFDGGGERKYLPEGEAELRLAVAKQVAAINQRITVEFPN